MDTHTRQVWFSRLGTASTETLRRLAVWGNLATAAIIAAAPFISPRPVSERPLYLVTAAPPILRTSNRRGKSIQ